MPAGGGGMLEGPSAGGGGGGGGGAIPGCEAYDGCEPRAIGTWWPFEYMHCV